MKQIHILTLVYDINFRDADEGDCFAGEGRKLISVHSELAKAQAIVTEFNPIFTQAEKNNIAYPVQNCDRILKARFGFTCRDIESDGYNFKLTIESFDVVD